METEDALRELWTRAEQYPPERYPVQHGVAQFHLGVALANLERFDEADAALATAAEQLKALPVEGAKALNARGAVLRALGRRAEAVKAFTSAGDAFDRAELPLERGAAVFNLGLVLREDGDAKAARDAFAFAHSLLDERRVPTQAAAVSRELGATELELGELDRAVASLEEARERAERALDHVELGGAANLLGLAHLARGDARAAAVAFTTAAGSHPRTLRPREFALAKANLALAHERAGDVPRARLAARQALSIAEVDEPVRSQAQGIVERVGVLDDDLLRVLDDLPDGEDVQRVLREELVRTSTPGERIRDAAAWIDGVLARPERTASLVVAWVGALLELPQDALDAAVRATIDALHGRDADEVERFHDELRMAAAHFHAPQMQRIESHFERAAVAAGVPWS